MKSHEGELVREISKLQGIVAELKAGFSRALLELSHIQHGDSRLQSQLQETQTCCHKRALHLEALVQSLREELGEVRAQIRLLCGNRFKAEPESKTTQSAEARAQGSALTPGNSETGHSSGICQPDGDGGCPCQCQCPCPCVCSMSASPSSSLRAGLLLHCYLQGLRAGQYQATDGTVNCQVVPMCVRVPQTVIGSWGSEMPRPCSLEGRRQQVIVQLLQSEWEYVSSLGQLYDKYKSPPELANAEPQKVFLRHVEQLLQRHLVFRNALEEKLAADQWRCLVGDVFGKLTGHGEAAFSEAYLGYVSTLPAILNAEISRVPQVAKTHNAQGCQEKKEGAGLISLLFSPVSRIHSYLSIIQSLLDWTGGDHPDRHLLEDTQRILGHIRSRGHTLLEQDVQSEERPAAAVTGLRCEIPSPDCPPSAFSKYSPNSRDTLTRSQPHRQDNPIDNSHPSSLCHPAVNAAGVCWNQGPSAWSLPPDATPVRVPVPAPRERPGEVRFVLDPSSEQGGGATTDSDPGQGPSPQPLVKRMYTSEVYHVNSHQHSQQPLQQVVELETDPEDLGDASVFDYSSVTTCSPDDTLELHHPHHPHPLSHHHLHANGCMATERSNGTEESREEEDEEEEEDSQIPVLLKPSYTLPRLKPSGQRPPLSPRLAHRERDAGGGGHRDREGGGGGGGQGHRDGPVCTRWQIPRAAPNPPMHTQAHAQMQQAGSQVCIMLGGGGGGGGGTVERRERRVKLQRQPSRAFRPIWDQPYRQGDETPDRDQSQPQRGVTSQGHPTSKPQQDRDGVRSSLYSGGATQMAAHGNRNAWNESEESEGPCSTV